MEGLQVCKQYPFFSEFVEENVRNVYAYEDL